jgi:hypothetical protein
MSDAEKAIPKAMVLVYEPALTHSVWQDYWHLRRSRVTLERELRRGVKQGRWVAWRLIYIEKEVMGIT